MINLLTLLNLPVKKRTNIEQNVTKLYYNTEKDQASPLDKREKVKHVCQSFYTNYDVMTMIRAYDEFWNTVIN